MISIIIDGTVCRIADDKSLMNFYSKVVFNNLGVFPSWTVANNDGVKFLTSRLDKMINLIYAQNLTVETKNA